MRYHSPSRSRAGLRGPRIGVRAGFTLIELLVVMVIIGILASIGLPAMKGIGQTNVSAATYRQILDDLNFARLKAISERTTVYMVFVSTNIQQKFTSVTDPNELRSLTTLITKQFTSYALIADRTVGDQPGQRRARYLSDWKSLPDGMLFAPYLFDGSRISNTDEYLRSLPQLNFQVPNIGSSTIPLPYIAFNSLGQLISNRGDEMLAFAKGSILYPRDEGGKVTSFVPDIILNPPGDKSTNFSFVRIDSVTGRTKAEVQQIVE
jgi:prepilin-type N-terminal cleavage/methylation domain-containing protein